MTIKDRHDSMRGYFAFELYQAMKKDKDIWLVVGDLGYKVWDQHFKDFPERCINPGAAEQAGAGICVGLALEGRKPFFYSITPFLLWRPAETIRLYINHEKIPVRLVGSGRDDDYKHDGFSHNAEDTHTFLDDFENIIEYWPAEKEDVPEMVKDLVTIDAPQFISLKR